MARQRIARLTAIVLAALTIGTASVLAHHSFSMFDTGAPITIAGVVSSVEWTNPHVYIELDLTEPIKGAKHWSIELGSPSILQRGGWKFNTVKKGDKVSAVVSPLRNGEPGSLLTRITLSDGPEALTNVLTGATVTGSELQLSGILAEVPVAVLLA